MLTWHNAWMAGHGRELAREVRAVGSAVAAGDRPLAAVAVVVGVAVLREGSEVVLFLYGILASGGTSVAAMMSGGAFGVALGVALSALIYLGLLAVPAHRLFTVTTGLITLLAAGLAAQAVFFLQQADYLRASNPAMGHVLAARRRQHPRAAVAYAGRLHRDAGCRAGACLWAGHSLDAGDDAPGARQERHRAPGGACIALTAGARLAGPQGRRYGAGAPRRVATGQDAAHNGNGNGAWRARLRMKVYEGGRSLDGAVVTVDGVPLDPRFDIHRFSRMGSSGPTKAMARGNSRWRCWPTTSAIRSRALALTEVFMRGVVAELDNAWRLTSDEIDAAAARTWSAAIPDVLRRRDRAGCACCRPMLADVPALFRFLGDPQAMRFTHCRCIAAGLPPSYRGARVVPSPDGYAPWTVVAQVRWPNHRLGRPVQRPVRPTAGASRSATTSTRQPGAKGMRRNWSQPAWTLPTEPSGCPVTAFAHAGNVGSRRVLHKAGFEQERFVPADGPFTLRRPGPAAPSRTPAPSSPPPARGATNLPPRSGCRRSCARRPRCPPRSSASGAAARASPPAPAR